MSRAPRCRRWQEWRANALLPLPRTTSLPLRYPQLPDLACQTSMVIIAIWFVVERRLAYPCQSGLLVPAEEFRFLVIDHRRFGL